MAGRVAHDLAIAAPASLIYAITTVLLFMFDSEPIAWAATVSALVVPFVLGLYVFLERPVATRILLAVWGPVGQWAVLLVVWFAVWRNAGRLPAWLDALATVGPLVALLAASALYWRGLASSSGRVGAGVLWLIALAEGAAALPLAEWLAETAGVDTLAAVAVLMAPAAAFGTWAGLACAAALPFRADEETRVEAGR